MSSNEGKSEGGVNQPSSDFVNSGDAHESTDAIANDHVRNSEALAQSDGEPNQEEKPTLIGHKRSLESEDGAQGDETENQTQKWPGWPGDNVFRLLIPLHAVGAIIGRKGQLVRKLCDETRSRIKILDGIPGTEERVVLVSGREDPDALLSPAMEGFLKVHRRVVEGSDSDGSSGRIHSSNISAKMLLPASQAGNLIGRQGSTIKNIQDSSGAVIRILPIEDLPLCALEDDRLVDISGSPASVEHALQLILQHLRRFLVDRSALILFEQTHSLTHSMQRAHSRQRAEAAIPSYSHISSSHSSIYRSHGRAPAYSDHYADPYADPYYDHYAEQYPPHSDQYPSSQHQADLRDHSAYDLPSHPTSASSLNPLASISQVVTMQVPLSYADAIIGAGGANIMYLRSTSGATVTIQESRSSSGVPDMTIEIRGTTSQVETAQLLLQSFMSNQNGSQSATKTSTEYASQRGLSSASAYSEGGGYATTEGGYTQNYGY